MKIGRKYMLNGQEVQSMPSSLSDYSAVTVDYEVMPGRRRQRVYCHHCNNGNNGNNNNGNYCNNGNYGGNGSSDE